MGAANIVDLVRNVTGPEPLGEQPRAMRLFAIIYLGAPIAMLLFLEWQFSRLIPLWTSLPLTVIALGSGLWRYLRRAKGDEFAAQERPVSAHHQPSSDGRIETDDVREARMFARFLISEIKLYNGDLVAEGVRNGSMYHLLKKQIDRARALYDSRVPKAAGNVDDYFHQELVRILADGKPDRL
jgi:hypothetical protein